MDRLLEATARAEREHFWFRGFRRFVSPFLDAAVAGMRHPRILDCGCGTGHNLSWLRHYGSAVGIDLTWTGLDFARSRGERAVAQASAATLPFAANSFDIVTSFDVLTALDEVTEAAAIAEMYRVLGSGGHLVLNAAAMESLKGNHSVLAREVRRYSKPLLRQRLEDAGFEVKRITYTNAAILPLLLGVRLAQRLSGHEESQDEISVPAAPVNAALSGLLAIEATALRVVNMPCGSSLLALARKSERR